MDVREKLVELLTEFYGCDPAYYGVDALRVGADDGRNPTHLMGWKNRKENDYVAD